MGQSIHIFPVPDLCSVISTHALIDDDLVIIKKDLTAPYPDKIRFVVSVNGVHQVSTDEICSIVPDDIRGTAVFASRHHDIQRILCVLIRRPHVQQKAVVCGIEENRICGYFHRTLCFYTFIHAEQLLIPLECRACNHRLFFQAFPSAV